MQSAERDGTIDPPPWAGLSVTAATFVAYALVHAVLADAHRGLSPLLLAPILVGAWTMGLRGGLASATVAAALEPLLHVLRSTGHPMDLATLLPTVLAGFLVGGVAGRLADIRRKRDHQAGAFGREREELLHEIARRRRAQEALRRERDFTRRLVETVDALVVGVDLQGRITVFNQAAERTLGYSRDEVLGEDWFSLFVPRTIWPEVWEAFLRLSDGELPPQNETLVLTRSGEPRLVSWRNSPLSENDRVVGVISFGLDVTDRKRSEALLRESEARYRFLAENSSDMIVRHLADLRTIYVSPASRRLLGREPEELLGEKWLGFLHPNDVKGVTQSFSELAAADDVVTVTARANHRDGSPRWLEATTRAVRDEAGAVQEYVSVVRDITDRKRLEHEAEEQRARMGRNERLSALGTLVAGVAHEINNPLTYITGNVELALMDIAQAEEALVGSSKTAPDLGETRRALTSSLQGAERIARITKALRAVARSPAAAEREPVKLNQVARNVEELVRVGVPASVDLEVETCDDDPEVMGAAAELHQVLLNLTRNAIDATQQKGGRVRIRCGVAGANAILEVADDGPGISQEAMTQLFTPFYTTKIEGTGLGLSIVHRIVGDHGGDISVRSAPGRGASFTVMLPRRPSESAGQPRVRSPTAGAPPNSSEA